MTQVAQFSCYHTVMNIVFFNRFIVFNTNQIPSLKDPCLLNSLNFTTQNTICFLTIRCPITSTECFSPNKLYYLTKTFLFLSQHGLALQLININFSLTDLIIGFSLS